jgi:predicted aspartyl protease
MAFTHPDRRTAALGLLAGVLAAPGLARAQMHEPARVEPAKPAEPAPDSVLAASADASDRLTVPVTVNGRGPFPFIVDTGSTSTVVSEVLAAQLGLPAVDHMLVKAATGRVETGAVRVESLAVGRRRLSNMHAPVFARTNIGGLGMLGIDAVSGQKLVMDFRKRQMLLTASTGRAEDPSAVTVTARSKYGQLLLVDCDVEGMSLYVILDTGGEMTIGNIAMRAMLERHREASEVQVISVTGDSVNAPIGVLRTLNVGHVRISNQPIAYTDLYAFDQFGLHDKPAMLLGMSTLRQFAKVSIDFPAREVSFLLKDA